MNDRVDDERLDRIARLRILALVSLFVVLMAIGMLSLRNLKQATVDEERSIALLLDLGRFERALHEAEVGEREYLLTGSEAGLARFEEAAAELEHRLEAIDRVAVVDAKLRPVVAPLRESVAARLEELRRAVSMRLEHGLPETGELVAAIESSETAGDVQDVKSAARAEIEERTRARVEEVEESYRVAMVYLAVGGVLGVLVLGVLMLAMTRNLRSERLNRRELLEQRELLRATLSGIDDVVVATTRDSEVRYVNRVGERLFGRPQLEQLGRRIHDEVVALGLEDDDGPPKPELRHLMDGEGVRRTFESRTAPMRDRAGFVVGTVTVLRDVSEVRRMQQMVAESEALKTAILDTAFDCIVTVDEDGRVIEFNPAACRTFGYDPTEVVGCPIADLVVPPEEREMYAAAMERYLETGESEILGRPIELLAMRSDGTRFPMEAFISAISFNGRTCYTGYLRDITERRRDEEARETQIRLLALAADVGAALARPGTLEQVLNDCSSVLCAQLEARAVQIWLRDRTEEAVRLRGRTSGAGRTDASEPARLTGESWIARVVRTGAPVSTSAEDWGDDQVELHADDGAVVVCHPILLDQEAIGAVAVFLDGEFPLSPSAAIASVATEIALGIERLRSEDRVQHLLERERVRSERLEQLSSVSATIHAANTRSSVIAVIEEETRRILGAARSEISFGEGAVRAAPNELTAPLRGPDGRSIGHLRLLPDRTGAFDALDRFVLRQLAGMAAVALDNARLYSELQEAARRKDEFLATLAHELRNPLAPVRNALAIMERSHDDPEVVARYRATVERQIHHLARLVDDLLDISRIDRGKLSLRRRRVRLADVVEEAVEASRSAMEESDHELTVSLSDEALEVDVDEDRLAQVLLNLLNNAAKFTEQGGRIGLSVRAEGDCVLLRVEDDGIGIAPENLPRVFDLFSQAGRRSDRAVGGLGVGLTLVRQLVEMHGGRVEAESEGLGEGSAFVVTLPLAAPATDAPAPAGDTPAAPEADREEVRRVLVVDDQHDSADTLSTLLEMMGHEVTTAYDGEQAVEKAREESPELVFLDIGLPGITGYEAAQRIRALPGGERTLLVALTGWGQEAARKRSLRAGFDRHLVKPLKPSVLEEVLAALPRTGPPGANGDGT